ncbi:tigger transposable element-derived protein 6-like [Ornithodoros turicata]|uniref:tigger transposable element-derived protein 6-like n=1 Tax=Ornithodoros turicata TaxID=34597 RepID=UPI003138B899
MATKKVSTTRKQFSLEEKMAVLNAVDTGRKKCDVAREFGISASTLSTFLKDRAKLEREYGNSGGAPSRKRMRAANFEDIDKAVYKWFLEVRSQDIPVSGPMLCAKARYFSCIYGVDDKFKGSEGWLQAFRARHDIVFRGLAGDEKSAPQAIAVGWREQEIVKLLSEYDPEDVFNADETALFFRLLPERTTAVKGEKCKGGKKSKERITVLLQHDGLRKAEACGHRQVPQPTRF